MRFLLLHASVFGTGHVGPVQAVALTGVSHPVVGVGIDSRRVNRLQRASAIVSSSNEGADRRLAVTRDIACLPCLGNGLPWRVPGAPCA
ncbi:hypothetical protein [Pseudomonas sp. NFIX28]|uniref:hypothetical protein n=1 Tax=Pseudomonas sp. NFIX28 TaxID=1566235 RepID=UPI000B835EBF|nr:hypothetical protein [Pseudomonas sp. NFIX28]